MLVKSAIAWESCTRRRVRRIAHSQKKAPNGYSHDSHRDFVSDLLPSSLIRWQMRFRLAQNGSDRYDYNKWITSLRQFDTTAKTLTADGMIDPAELWSCGCGCLRGYLVARATSLKTSPQTGPFPCFPFLAASVRLSSSARLSRLPLATRRVVRPLSPTRGLLTLDRVRDVFAIDDNQSAERKCVSTSCNACGDLLSRRLILILLLEQRGRRRRRRHRWTQAGA